MKTENTTPCACGKNACTDAPQDPPRNDRRGFLGVAAASLAGIMLAPGIRLIEVAQAATPAGAMAGASPKVRWGMLIDTTKCTPGCTACVTACQTENGLPTQPGPTDSQWIRKIEIKEIKTGKTASLPMMCQHCAEPPCVDVCPTGASFKRADGIVLVDKHICIGCRYCMMACPYKARSFVHEPQTQQKPDVPRGMGTVEACTMCVHKVDKGENPACMTACAAAGYNAIVFGDLNDPNSEISQRVAQYQTRQLREDLNLNTGVRYQGL
jgi:molybdopterin-containing oxidoreductase family iron-sulfur binding subunit